MKHQETLRLKLGKFTSMTILLVLIAAIAIIGAQAYYGLKSKRMAVADALIRSASSQTDLLIPTFVLPEQRRGQNLVLDKIIHDDGLESAMLISEAREIPQPYSKCKLSPEGSSCLNESKDALATITAITDAGQTFGYLFKVKSLASMASQEHSITMMGSVALVLIVTFALLFWGMNRITSREVPRELDAVVKWIEEYLKESASSPAPNLKFKEFSHLGQKISELIDRHDHARDQAIIGQFVSGIMHDIRTPLQSLVTAVELIRESPTDSTARQELLENLYHVSQMKLPLIGQIIETTLDGSRSVHVEKKISDLNKTVKDAVDLHKDLVSRRKGSLGLITPNTPLPTSHDPTQIIRVVSNLVKNGIEAASEGAKSPKVSVRVSDSGADRVSIWVEDSGPGIPVHPDRLFRLFRSKKRHGSGLGLLVSRKIVESHDGKLRVGRSEILGGAKFEIELPRGEFVVSTESSVRATL